MGARTPEFDAAVEASRKLLAKPSDDELLMLYALFKQGMQDPSFENAPTPGTFDFKGKYKYNEWKKLVDAGVTPEDAQQRYVDLIERLKAKYGYDESKEPEQVGR
ncbi:acyl-CoA-binding protein (ACBP)/diazepam binding inhibitor (DBI)/endozepine (EP) [Ophidiomyces ophidiicola]|nr:acyl-CoA-binding protein (ACBP)/diazepam binding inhibitor (DBI)/endozepine (EP) [Ophidiomyces ophidiicola]KAI1935924.1 acyl-CoA-binding protein (ACBP)/diazepam binding inhibitor (DBI)/endozepine (EP) [Ophidiomyces ophidiicola]KAI1958825.1 acyl-CoA-binding protein (ACBP)/diazepam binding inhibitor (DBI)/endozepine (EP) [Ophidiomyces ophidiicola]